MDSRRTLFKAMAAALVAAVVVLVLFVMPAEYGIDPTGVGGALGLTAISAPALAPVPPPQGDTLAPTAMGPVSLYPGQYKYDVRTIELGPYEYIEFKYHLEQGAAMLFSWRADGDVMHDFHGDREGAAADAAQSFDGAARRQADGSFIAPFTGIHGWFWENPGGETVTITLHTAGFYTSGHQFNSNRTRETHEVRSLDTISVDN
jgi:hypothetical protein